MPFYSLETIHEVAQDENKIFLSRLAQRDAEWDASSHVATEYSCDRKPVGKRECARVVETHSVDDRLAAA